MMTLLLVFQELQYMLRLFFLVKLYHIRPTIQAKKVLRLLLQLRYTVLQIFPFLILPGKLL